MPLRASFLAVLLALAAALPAAAAEPVLRGRPGEEERARLLLELLLEEKRFDEAEAFAGRLRAERPQDPAWLEFLARSASLRGRPRRASELFLAASALAPGRADLLKSAGLESLYAGDLRAAGTLLEKARVSAPRDPDVVFALSELAFARGDKPAGRRLAAEALALLPASNAPDAVRRRLRLQSRLGWSEELGREYAALARSSPKRPEPLVDWAEALLAYGLFEQASEPIGLLEERFPDRTDASRRLRAEQSRARADDHLRHGRPRKALAALAPLELPGDPYGIADLARDLRHETGTYAGPTFRYYGLPTETSVEEGFLLRGSLAETVRLEADAVTGRYRVSDLGFDRRVRSGEARLSWRPARAFRLGAVAGGVSGSLQDRFSPGGFAELKYERFSAAASYRARRFLNEFAQAVAAGSVADETKASFESRPLSKVYLNGRYQYNHYRNADGARGWKTELVPAAGLVLFDKPYVTAGYQYVYEDAAGSDAFFTALPLVRRARTHYATLYAGQRFFRGRLLAELFAYNGADSGRNIDFWKGDAAGGGVNLHWEAGRRLCLIGGYEYNRQSATGLAGEGHLVIGRVELRL